MFYLKREVKRGTHLEDEPWKEIKKNAVESRPKGLRENFLSLKMRPNSVAKQRMDLPKISISHWGNKQDPVVALSSWPTEEPLGVLINGVDRVPNSKNNSNNEARPAKADGRSIITPGKVKNETPRGRTKGLWKFRSHSDRVRPPCGHHQRT